MGSHGRSDNKGMARTEPRVLICGAGFAGLSAAWWMRSLGYAVTVVELARGLRKGGTPVNIRDGVIDVVRRMGLLERIQSACLPPRPVTFLDKQGTPLSQDPAQAEQEPDEEYEIERDLLLDMLFELVQGDVEFLFGDSIAGLQESGEEITVTFSSGGTQPFSLVLGCDGTHSSVRRMCFGEEPAFLVSLRNYFSLTIVSKLLIQENTSQMFSVPGKTVMLNAYNGKTDIAFCFSSEAGIPYDRRDRNLQKSIIAERFRDGRWRTPELLEEMRHCDDFYFDKLCQIRMSSWSKGRVALVGDAGYCPSPAAGMGGSVAILGAAALADALRDHPDDFKAAFEEYDRSLRPTVEGIQDQAIEFGLEMFMPGSEEAIQRRNLQLGLS